LIEIGDIIIKVGDTSINNESDLFSALEELKPGDMVDVTVNRLAAVNDELKVKEFVFQVVLQSSADVQNKMQVYMPDPQ
jgi:S1-C subfamily serine protease